MIKNKSGLMAFIALVLSFPASRVNAQVSAAEVLAGAVPAQVTASTAPAGAPTLAVQDLVASARQYADAYAAGLSAEEKGKRLEIKGRISGILDLREMAHLILVKQWNGLKPAEREKYASLMAALVEKIGYPQIEKFFNGHIEITYTGEKPLDGGKAAVFTSIFYKDEDLTLPTEFRMYSTAKGWRVYDVITDGESLLLIYRNQHSGIIKDKGFPALIKLMEKKFNEAK